MHEHPVVYWAADPHWPPFSTLDNQGRISGIDVEIVKLLASRTGLNIKFVPTRDWTETLLKAKSGEIDFIGGIARTEERERMLNLRFTEVFCKFPTAIVTSKKSPFLVSLHTLRSSRVALPRDYATTEEFRRNYPQVRIVLTDNEAQSMLAVAENKADSTVVNLASACYIVHTYGLSNLKISGLSEVDFFLSVAVRHDDPQLLSILSKGLATIGPLEKEDIYAAYITPETLNAINWRTWRRRLTYSAIAGGALLAAVLLWNRRLSREIKRRTVAEASLRRASGRLEEHAKQLQILNSKLVAANKDLEAFSYSVSHDLRAPLRRILSFAQLVELRARTALDEAAQQYIRTIQQEGRRMLDLVEALLAMARLDRAKLHLAPVNMETLAQEVIHELEKEASGRELRWEVQSMPTAQCDPGLMKQVFVNLLNNAAKFTRGRSPAIVQVGVLPGQATDRETVFFVKDNGAGFEKNQAGHLFEAFHRLHPYSQYEGSGIGLANVKRIIQKHGGRVWAEGEANLGATFYFSLIRNGQHLPG